MGGRSALDFRAGCVTLEGMCEFQKYRLSVLVLSGVLLAYPVFAQVEGGGAPPQVDRLLAQLSEPDTQNWQALEEQITALWSSSGSPAMDLLLARGNAALEAEDLPAALDYFGALTDHAPDFAEGWNAEATVYFMMGQYSLAIADVERVLALNPQHFGAMAGLGLMLELMGETQHALTALEAAQKLNPHRPEVQQAVKRLQQAVGEADL